MFDWLFPRKITDPAEVEILNAGLDFALFLYNYGKPVQPYLHEHFPALGSAELDKYGSICRAAAVSGTDEVYKLVRKKGKSLRLEDLRPAVLKKYPWVSDKNISHMIGTGLYLTEK